MSIGPSGHTLRRTCQRHIERECTSSNFTASAETLASPFFSVLCIRYVPIGPRLMRPAVTSHPGSLVCWMLYLCYLALYQFYKAPPPSE